MQILPIHITTQQREKLFRHKAKTNVSVAVQIRLAIDEYLKKHEEEYD